VCNKHQAIKSTDNTLTPSPVSAEQACICHFLSLIESSPRPSATSPAVAALNKSCLLANTKSGAPINLSSSKSSDNSWKQKKLWKERLNSDGQQFHQYKQTNNHFLPRSIEHKKKRKKKETMIYAVGIPGSSLRQAQEDELWANVHLWYPCIYVQYV